MTQARDLGDAANKANFLDNVSSDIIELIAAATPAGVIIPFGGNSAPPGYLACVGQLVARSSYVSLYAAIGTLWNTGGEDSAAFRLPDLRGAFLRGTGLHGAQTKADGGAYGSSFRPSGSFEADQFQAWQLGGIGHGGSNYFGKLDTGGNKRTDYSAQSGEDYPRYNTTFNGSANRLTALTDNTNGTPRSGDETRPFNAGILYCIKT